MMALQSIPLFKCTCCLKVSSARLKIEIRLGHLETWRSAMLMASSPIPCQPTHVTTTPFEVFRGVQTLKAQKDQFLLSLVVDPRIHQWLRTTTLNDQRAKKKSTFVCLDSIHPMSSPPTPTTEYSGSAHNPVTSLVKPLPNICHSIFGDFHAFSRTRAC